MAKVEAMTERDRIAAEVLEELNVRPPGQKLTREELVALLRRMPPMPPGWSSAEYIRELRGPLPEDDPDYPRDDRD
ncbi:MAG TPA: hypothetical protein VEO54_31830 [Thermoanaerobaculia bacterium]|nr:hypothetical protein [Thermoanaerobaculia bacterium]